MKTRTNVMPSLVVHMIMILVAIAMIAPFMWIFSTSLRLPRESFSLPPTFFPTSFRWQNYIEVFRSVPFSLFIFNSLKVSVISTILMSFTSAMAAYAFARLRFKGNHFLFILVLTGLMIPGQVTIIPLFILIKKFGLMNTHWALILPSIIYPLGIFLIRQFMLSIPKSYDEAAYMDGAGYSRIFWSIMLPMTFSSVTVIAVMSFINIWNDFFRPLIFLNTYELMTLPLGLTILSGFMGNGNISVILAGVTLSLVAPLLFYIVGQRYLVEGMTMVGVKG
jgi:multiple sugar transport system permease protein